MIPTVSEDMFRDHGHNLFRSDRLVLGQYLRKE